MKYYLHTDENKVYVYEDDIDVALYNDITKLKELSEVEADLIANPPLTQQELDQQQESKNIAFLSDEIKRTEIKLTQLYRVRDRNKASESHLSQIEELEDYSTDLMLVEDQEGYPLRAVFPTCPDFFSE